MIKRRKWPRFIRVMIAATYLAEKERRAFERQFPEIAARMRFLDNVFTPHKPWG